MTSRSMRRVVAVLAVPFALAMTTGTMSAHATDGTDQAADSSRSQSSTHDGRHHERAHTDEKSRSSATIRLTECMVESTKDISYVEFLSGGTSVRKHQGIDSRTLDLRTVTGIHYDRIRVKSANTVETFPVTGCADTDGRTGGDAGEDNGDGDGHHDGDADGHASGGGDAESDDQDSASDHESSTATITLNDCTVESSEDISYVAFLSGGTGVKKHHGIDDKSFDLRTVTGIDYDHVEVKSATTIKTFPVVGCADTGADTGDNAGGDTNGQSGGDTGGQAGGHTGGSTDGSTGGQAGVSTGGQTTGAGDGHTSTGSADRVVGGDTTTSSANTHDRSQGDIRVTGQEDGAGLTSNQGGGDAAEAGFLPATGAADNVWPLALGGLTLLGLGGALLMRRRFSVD